MNCSRMQLGTHVRFYRFQMGYSQEQLAEKCNVSARYISNIENAEGNITMDTLDVLAVILKVEPYMLLKPYEHGPLPSKINTKSSL